MLRTGAPCGSRGTIPSVKSSATRWIASARCFLRDRFKRPGLYLTACGLYEARLNGRRVGDALLTPGSTDYRKRIQYQVYDVTDLLRGGENAMTVELADGWYRGSNGGAGQTNTFGTQTKLLAQLELTLADGTTQTVCSDGSWAWSNDGPIRFADLKDGEIVDANREPSYSGSVRVVEEHAPLTASDNVPVLERERFAPVERITTPSGKTVLKYAQNLSGYVSFRVTAHKGQRVHITMGETLDDSGELTLRNIQCITKGRPSPLQELDYTCREGVNEYTPKFYYGGFQYAQVDTDVEFRTEDFTAVAVYSAFEETSKFECSNRLISQFYHNTLWSLKSNSTDVPTDCPTRERMGLDGRQSGLLQHGSPISRSMRLWPQACARHFDPPVAQPGRLPQIAPFANESPKHQQNERSRRLGRAQVSISVLFLSEIRRRPPAACVLRQHAALCGLYDPPRGEMGRDLRQAHASFSQKSKVCC